MRSIQFILLVIVFSLINLAHGASRPLKPSKSNIVRVMTYNVKQLPCWEKTVRILWFKKKLKFCPLKDDWTHNRKQRRAELVRFLKSRKDHVQIVGLQELFWGKFNENEIKNIARSAGYPYVAFGPEARRKSVWDIIRRRLNGVVSSGLVILSQYPIKKKANFKFSKCTISDCYADKGAQFVQVVTPDGRYIDVFNTHAQAGSYEGIKVHQFAELERFVKKHQRSGIAFYLGDFNSGNIPHRFPHSWKRLNRFMQNNATRTCRREKCRANGHGIKQFLAERVLDHIFYSNDIYARVNYVMTNRPQIIYKGKPFGVSDHLPLMATFEIH